MQQNRCRGMGRDRRVKSPPDPPANGQADQQETCDEYAQDFSLDARDRMHQNRTCEKLPTVTAIEEVRGQIAEVKISIFRRRCETRSSNLCNLTSNL